VVASARRAEREPITINCSLVYSPQAGSKGQPQSPWWGVSGRRPPEAESFLSIFIQKEWPKVKGLNDSSPLVSEADSLAQPRSTHNSGQWQWGVRPYLYPPLCNNTTIYTKYFNPHQPRLFSFHVACRLLIKGQS